MVPPIMFVYILLIYFAPIDVCVSTRMLFTQDPTHFLCIFTWDTMQSYTGSYFGSAHFCTGSYAIWMHFYVGSYAI